MRPSPLRSALTVDRKGIELLIYEFEDNTLVGGWFAVVIAMLFALFNYHLERVTTMPFGPFWFRKALKDYNFLLCVIFFTGFVHMSVTRVRAALIAQSWQHPQCRTAAAPRRRRISAVRRVRRRAGAFR